MLNVFFPVLWISVFLIGFVFLNEKQLLDFTTRPLFLHSEMIFIIFVNRGIIHSLFVRGTSEGGGGKWCEWINWLGIYIALFVYCCTPKALYNHVCGRGSLLNHHQCAASTWMMRRLPQDNGASALTTHQLQVERRESQSQSSGWGLLGSHHRQWPPQWRDIFFSLRYITSVSWWILLHHSSQSGPYIQ